VKADQFFFQLGELMIVYFLSFWNLHANFCNRSDLFEKIIHVLVHYADKKFRRFLRFTHSRTLFQR
jgi:uncharacterized membrane protein